MQVTSICQWGCGLTLLLFGSALWAGSAPEPGQWRDASKSELGFEQVIDRLAGHQVVILGEAHDSSDTHQVQARVIDALAKRRGAVALGMEQLDLEYAQSLDRQNQPGSVRTARSIAKAGGFDEQSWGWSHYEAIFAKAAYHSLPVFPLNLSRDDARIIATSADDEWQLALTDQQLAVIDQYAPDLRLPTQKQQALQSVLVAAHCGEVSAQRVSHVARAQVARDVLMADAIIDAIKQQPGHQIVTIMGNQHALKTRGVPYWLAEMADGVDLAVVGMLPVNTPGGDSAVANVPPRFDLRYFAKPVDRPDFCAESGH